MPIPPRRWPSLRTVLVALVLPASIALSACGSDGETEVVDAEAPAASEFPRAEGRTTEELFADEAPSDEIVISPTGQVYREGKNRFGFGVFTTGREQIPDAEVAIYAGPPKGAASGPFPARIESMKTEPEFTARTTATDPDAAKVVYVSELELDKPGEWRLLAMVREGDTLHTVRVPSIEVGSFPKVPAVGEKPPAIHTPTADEVGNLSKIDTREPHGTMHEADFADVVGERPAVLVFATPLLCQSRVCGPVVDIAEQVKAASPDTVEFIHMEIFEDNDPGKGLREQVEAFGLPTEPWLYAVDEDGKISTAIEGAFGVDELEAAVEKISG